MEIKGSDKESKHEVNDFLFIQKKTCGITQKLSLQSSSSSHKRDSDGDIQNHCHLLLVLKNDMEAKEEKKELRGMPDEHNLRYEKLHGIRRKLSLDSSSQFHKRDGHDIDDVQPNHLHSLSNPQTVSMASLGSPKALHILQSVDHDEKRPCNDSVDGMENGSSFAKYNKIRLVGKKLSLGLKGPLQGQEKEDKENVVPMHKMPFSNPQTPGKTGIGQKISLEPLTQLRVSNEDGSQPPLHSQNLSLHAFKKQEQSNLHQNSQIAGGIERWAEESPVAESVIVLDSEDSDEECNGSARSKSSLVRKRIAKRKAQA